MPISETSNDPKIVAIKGEDTGEGGIGVWGISKSGHGVHGDSKGSRGVFGTSDSAEGVFGKSKAGSGVRGESGSNGAGVVGQDTGEGGIGVWGISKSGHGVHGDSTGSRGVVGTSDSAEGVLGKSKTGSGVRGESGAGVGIYGKGGRLAGLFEGDVEVTGDIRMANADCAEEFDLANADLVEPGTVMVLGDDGTLQASDFDYDKRVVGVVSGAGAYKPGIVLDKQGARPNRKPIALLGKVCCKVDATYAPVAVGDLLTTSPTPGNAMKASDHLKAPGAVIGKALQPLRQGQDLIPILVALQ